MRYTQNIEYPHIVDQILTKLDEMAKVSVSNMSKEPSYSKYKNFLKADLESLTEDQEKDCFYVEDYFKKDQHLFVVDDTPGDWEDLIGTRDLAKGKITRTDEEKAKIVIREGFKDVDKLLEEISWEGLTEKEADEAEELEAAKLETYTKIEWFTKAITKLVNGKVFAKLSETSKVPDQVEKFKKGLTSLKSKLDRGKGELDELKDLPKKMETAYGKILTAIKKEKPEDEGPVINDIIFLDVSESSIKKMGDSDEILEKLAEFDLSDRHNSEPKLNTPQHEHLDGGSGGIAFTYRKEDDDSITPIVYDFATGRSNSGTGNSYKWKNNSDSSGPPSLPSKAK